MAVIIINPNSTAQMTDAMLAAARLAAPELEFEGWTSFDGPSAIQGAGDGRVAAAPLLELVQEAARRKADGIIVGCFDDTALVESALLASCPVIGLGQASYHQAALRNWRFSVVTTLDVSVPVIEGNIRAYGLAQHLCRVRASDVPVLALERDPGLAEHKVREQAVFAEREDQVDAVILGCAGMVQVTRSVRAAVSIAVIDPVHAAATSMSWLIPAAREQTGSA